MRHNKVYDHCRQLLSRDNPCCFTAVVTGYNVVQSVEIECQFESLERVHFIIEYQDRLGWRECRFGLW